MKRFLIIFEKTDSGFSVYAPDLPGCIATGRTKKFVERQIYEAIRFHLEGLKELHYKIPDSKTETEIFFFA